MTRKENLLVEIYNLRNQISEIKGNTIVNIEEFCQTRKFRDEAASWKEFELKLRIEELKKNLEKAKVEAAQQAAADAFYATEQGQAFKRECEEKRILLGSEYDCAESATLELIESHLQAALGKQWRAGRLSTSYMEVTVVDAENKPIFGQSPVRGDHDDRGTGDGQRRDYRHGGVTGQLPAECLSAGDGLQLPAKRETAGRRYCVVRAALRQRYHC